ncbi:flagellar protein FliT [Clostridium uliginosum]|uniref:Flagellar protein FliT n=1 Tax=Clostridium uliginosum TaxID=119641 RepID=A0A1I1KJE9_9CLOT|nr:flagellar protein FliT [Clostridium uliginosum]SFC60685.1 hypothetical protein SAMN05421842_10629 [Clostridium uliginosum]
MNFNVFNEYKEINLKIINLIKEDKEDVALLEKREETIKKFIFLDMEKSKFRKIYEDMGLRELDRELENALKEKMISVKNDIKKLKAGKEANKGYININRNLNFFSTKI